MDAVLCDELLQEILSRFPPPTTSAAAVSLVSRRWLRLHRAATTSLSLRLPSDDPSLSLSSFLPRFRFLSSLSVVSAASADRLLLELSASCSATLRQLRFLVGPVSPYSLLSLSSSLTHLTSLSVSLSRPLSLRWLASFRSLRDFSLVVCTEGSVTGGVGDQTQLPFGQFEAELPLQTICLSKVRAEDHALGWLWRSCRTLRRLGLRSCEGVGDGESFASFVNCLLNLQEVELRTCRALVNTVLLKLAENCTSLSSLLVYDGGSKEGLLQFITLCRCDLRVLDLRLPLDLDNDHLSAVATSFRSSLSSLRLQSCCLVTGEGLKVIGLSMASTLEELALINCDVMEREPGLLMSLGQNLRGLRKLDLSHNEMLVDKDLISMLVSCDQLVDLTLRGCKGLTGAAIVSTFKNCGCLESLDVTHCCGIEAEAIELLILNATRLRRVQVEAGKLSDAARTWARHKFVELVV